MFYLGNRNFFNIQSIKIMETNMKIMVVDDNEFSALSLKIMLDPLASLTLVSGENLSKRHENFNSIKIFKKPFDVQEFMQYIDSCG